MPIAMQTPEVEDPPDLLAVTTALVGSVVETLLKTFANPTLPKLL